MQASKPLTTQRLEEPTLDSDGLSPNDWDSFKKLPSDKRILLSAEGGFYSSNKVCEVLSLIISDLDKLRETDQIIGLRVEQQFFYPKWQFVGDRLLPGLSKVLSEFPSKSQWMRAGFMLDNGVSVDLASPLAALKAGKIDDVVHLVENYGEHGAA
jgi:hypothetical protein